MERKSGGDGLEYLDLVVYFLRAHVPQKGGNDDDDMINTTEDERGFWGVEMDEKSTAGGDEKSKEVGTNKKE